MDVHCKNQQIIRSHDKNSSYGISLKKSLLEIKNADFLHIPSVYPSNKKKRKEESNLCRTIGMKKPNTVHTEVDELLYT